MIIFFFIISTSSFMNSRRLFLPSIFSLEWLVSFSDLLGKVVVFLSVMIIAEPIFSSIVLYSCSFFSSFFMRIYFVVSS